MNSEHRRPDPSREEDSWEKLAEDLFGIDFSKPPRAQEPVSSEELATEGPQEEAPQEAPSPAAEPSPVADVEADVEVEESSFEAVEVTETGAAGFDEDEDFEDEDFGEFDEDVVEQAEAASASERRESDTYWDALNEWEWDEEAAGGKSPRGPKADMKGREREKPAPRSGPKERPSRREREQAPPREREQAPPREKSAPSKARPAAASPAEDRSESIEDDREDDRSEYIENEDFGAGLLETESATKAAAPEPAETAENKGSPPDIEKDKPRKPRRRRRRRSRAEEPEPPAGIETGKGADQTAGEAVEAGEVVEAGEAADESAAPSDESVGRRGRPSRRRTSRRHRKPAAAQTVEEEILEEEVVEEDFPEPDEDIFDEEEAVVESLVWDSETDESEDDDESAQEVAAAHRNLPSWEEAVSYLLNPRRAESGGSDPEGDAPPGQVQTKAAPSKPAGRRSRSRRRR